MKRIGKEQLKKLIESTMVELGNETDAVAQKKKTEDLKKEILRTLNQKVAVPFKNKEFERGFDSLISSLQSVLDKYKGTSMNEYDENMSEVKVEDPDLMAQIQEFYRHYKDFQIEKKKFEEIEKKFKASEDVMRTALEALEESEEKLLQAENIIVRIKKKGYESTTYKYKEAAEELYNRVNRSIQAIIDEIMETSKKITYIKSSIEVKTSDEEINEIALFTKAKEIFSNILSKFTKKLHYKNQDLEDSISHLESLV